MKQRWPLCCQDMGVMRRHQNAQRQHRRRAAAPPPLPTPTLYGGANLKLLQYCTSMLTQSNQLSSRLVDRHVVPPSTCWPASAGGAAQHPPAARPRSGRRRAATPLPLQPPQQPRLWPQHQEQPRPVPPPPRMGPPPGLGAYMPDRQPPQQVLSQTETPLYVLGISWHCWGTTAKHPVDAMLMSCPCCLPGRMA